MLITQRVLAVMAAVNRNHHLRRKNQRRKYQIQPIRRMRRVPRILARPANRVHIRCVFILRKTTFFQSSFWLKNLLFNICICFTSKVELAICLCFPRINSHKYLYVSHLRIRLHLHLLAPFSHPLWVRNSPHKHTLAEFFVHISRVRILFSKCSWSWKFYAFQNSLGTL